jgi:hypothetical protein
MLSKQTAKEKCFENCTIHWRTTGIDMMNIPSNQLKKEVNEMKCPICGNSKMTLKGIFEAYTYVEITWMCCNIKIVTRVTHEQYEKMDWIWDDE